MFSGDLDPGEPEPGVRSFGQSELRRSRAGVDAAHPGHLRAGECKQFRIAGAHGAAAHPDEVAPSYVFFAAGRLSSYYSGEVLAPIGGETLPG
jgi:hypothetical protein